MMQRFCLFGNGLGDFAAAEVAVHNTSSDCWIALNGKVYNLTPWLDKIFKTCHCLKNCSCKTKNWFCENCIEYCKCNKQGFFYCDSKREAQAILSYAGKDISHWFNGEEWRTYTHPITGATVPYQRHGHGRRSPVVPSTKWRPVPFPWWIDDTYVIGRATARTRPIRITNTITGATVTLEVCSEETIYEIMMRYFPHNRHLLSYTWRYMGRALDYDKTLEENGIPDERDRFSSVALPENCHIPAILIYYNDDLTEDPQREDCLCQLPCIPMSRPKECYLNTNLP